MGHRARHREFQAAVLRQLYPPSPSHNENEVKQEQIVDVLELLGNLQSEDDINANNSESPSDSVESCSQHLTRAQRKRIRKKKLKEAASNSKRIIGPLLPAKPTVEDFSTETPKCPDAEPSGFQSQQRSAISDIGKRKADSSKEIGSSTVQIKSKQRRHAKRLNQGTERSIQREQHGKVFMAESCGDGVVLKHV